MTRTKRKRNGIHCEPREGVEPSTPGLQDQCSNHWANEATLDGVILPKRSDIPLHSGCAKKVTRPKTNANAIPCQPREGVEPSTPGLQDQCSNHWANEAMTNFVALTKRSNIPLHSGCVEKVTRPKTNANGIPCQPREKVEPSTPGLRDQCSNHWANEATLDGVILPKRSDIPLHSGCAKKVTRPKTNANAIPCQPREGVEPSTPGLRDQCSNHWANEATVDSVILPKPTDISPCILGLRKLWSNRKRIQNDFCKPREGVEPSTPGLRDQCSNHWANEATLDGVILPKPSDISPCILGVRKLWSDRKRIQNDFCKPREGVEPSTPGLRDQCSNHWANEATLDGVILPKRSDIPLHSGCAKKVTRPKTNANAIPCQPREGVEPSTPGLRDQCSNHWANEATVDSVILPKPSDISPCILGLRKLWSNRKRIQNDFCKPREGVEPSTPGLRDQCSDHWANEATLDGVILPKPSDISPCNVGVRKLWSDRKRIQNDFCKPREGVEPSTPGLRDQCSNHWANEATLDGVILPKRSDIPLHSGCAKKVTRPKTNANAIPCQPREGVEPSIPGLRDQCSNHWANEATVDSVILPKPSDISPCILGLRKLWSNRKRIQNDFCKPREGVEPSTPGLRDQCSDHWANEATLDGVILPKPSDISPCNVGVRKLWSDRKRIQNDFCKPREGVEPSTPGLRDQCSNHWANEAMDRGVLPKWLHIPLHSGCAKIAGPDRKRSYWRRTIRETWLFLTYSQGFFFFKIFINIDIGEGETGKGGLTRSLS